MIWRVAHDGALEARPFGAKLEVWWDEGDPGDPGWAWRVTLFNKDGFPLHEESGGANSQEEAKREAEDAYSYLISKQARK